MGSITDPSPAAVVAEIRDYKRETLNNPDGVQYLDHLSALVMRESGLQVVMRTDAEVYGDVPVRAWWNYGNYDFDKEGAPLRSTLTFEIPDEISRRIQSRHASEIMRRFFGNNGGVELEQPVLGITSDATRSVDERWSGNGVTQEIVDDWDTLKTAISTTAADTAGYLGGQSIRYMSTAGEGYGLGRVQDAQLQLYIPTSVITSITGLWAAAFRKEVGI